MKMAGWCIGGIVALGGMAALWFGWPGESQRMSIAIPGPVTSASAKDAFGNRLPGEDLLEPIGDVIEVIDLSQVFEPMPEQDRGQPFDFDFDAFNRLPRPVAVDVPSPELVPYPREVTAMSTAARYGEETSEPPAVPSGPRMTIAEWMRATCVEWITRMMPLKGSASPPSNEPANPDSQ